MVCDALRDDKFSKQPEILGNCVRVYYSEGYHVDVPSFRVIDADTSDEHPGIGRGKMDGKPLIQQKSIGGSTSEFKS